MLYINFLSILCRGGWLEVAEVAWRTKNQLCWIELKIVSNDRYTILVYDNIIMLGIRGWLEVDWGWFWKMVEFKKSKIKNDTPFKFENMSKMCGGIGFVPDLYQESGTFWYIVCVYQVFWYIFTTLLCCLPHFKIKR